MCVLQFKGHTMSFAFKWFNIGLASLMAILAILSSIAAVRYIVVSVFFPLNVPSLAALVTLEMISPHLHCQFAFGTVS